MQICQKTTGLVAVLAASSFGAATAASAACTGTAAENKAVVERAINDGLNARDTAAIDSIFAPTYVDHSSDPLLPVGPEGVHIVQAALRTAFPDLQLAIQDQVAEGDMVASRVLIYGTNSGPYLGEAPTGNPFLVRAMRFDRVCDGMIMEHWTVVDGATLAAQLRTNSEISD